MLKMLKDKIKIHKYIGEKNRSIFGRGWEHLKIIGLKMLEEDKIRQ